MDIPRSAKGRMTSEFLAQLAQQEHERSAWLQGADRHPQGLSGEVRDVIPAILDQGYWRGVTLYAMEHSA